MSNRPQDVGRKLFTKNRRDLETDPHVHGSLVYNQGDLAGHTEMDGLVRQQYLITGELYESHE